MTIRVLRRQSGGCQVPVGAMNGWRPRPPRPTVVRAHHVLLVPIAMLFLAAMAFPASADPPTRPESPLPQSCHLEIGSPRAVSGVVDAATLRLADASEVRLLGILAPAAPDPASPAASWPPDRDARAAIAELTLGRNVVLAFSGRRTDRYGRALAHVLVDIDGRTLWAERELLAAGHARVYAPPGGTSCLDALLATEHAARKTARGLWANAAYAPVPAYATGRLWRLRGTYQLVEGWVAAVEQTRSAAYIQFTAPTHRVLRARVPVTTGRHRDGPDLSTLVRRRLRVRGWIEWRYGPVLTVSDPALIEVVDERGK